MKLGVGSSGYSIGIDVILSKLIIATMFCFFSFFAMASSSSSIEKYIVKIQPSFQDKSITGSTEIIFGKPVSGTIEFPLYGLLIDSILANGKPVHYSSDQSHVEIDFSKSKMTSVRSLIVNFHGSPIKGLVWGASYVYTNYDPCTWMICFEEPGVRAKFEIQLKVPEDMKIISNGNLVSVSGGSGGLRSEVWEESRSYASYLYGFAVGHFERVTQKLGSFELEYLGSSDNQDELKKKFKDTERIVRFFEEKSGVQIPLKKYTQVLIPGDEAQEKNGFSVLGKSFVDPILSDPTEDWAIVHELAHQWWGNLLTCKSWDHFWLNEGFVVFMTAAYKQVQWGQAAYDREMELAKKRYQRAIDAKFDVPLTFGGTYPSLGIKRAIVYSKGALFLDALREDVGEKAFWKGLKEYTLQNQLSSVESKDFQKAMEKSAEKSLSKIFERWVY